MCYSVASAISIALKYAKARGDTPEEIAQLKKQLDDWNKNGESHHYVSGFAHPKLMVFTNDKPLVPQAFTWGLIPSWVKDEATAKTLWNQTLNARAETIFEKPSFREPAKNKRCLVYVDAFYEHHHAKGKTYPFHIAMKDKTPMAMAGLWDEWVNKQTGEIIKSVSIVTTVGNKMMTKIHNNPKLEGARMPVILPKKKQNEWLAKANEETLEQLLIPFDDALLEYHTVRRLTGKEAVGDVPEVEEEYKYVDLDFN